MNKRDKKEQHLMVEKFLKDFIDKGISVHVNVKESSMRITCIRNNNIELDEGYRMAKAQQEWITKNLVRAKKKLSFYKKNKQGELTFGFRVIIPANKEIKWKTMSRVIWIRAKDLTLNQRESIINLIHLQK